MRSTFVTCLLVAGSIVFAPCPDAIGQADAVTSRIDSSTLAGHIQFLADDLLEGRGPGTTGDAITQLYLETQFKIHGLRPIPGTQSYRQSVPMIGISSRPALAWTLQSSQSPSNTLVLYYFDDYIAVAGKPENRIAIEDRELVFVGYGIQAPEYGWDDFKGEDLRGKILVMMNNDPERDTDLFAGARRLYYGRWDYKYESAARQGDRKGRDRRQYL